MVENCIEMVEFKVKNVCSFKNNQEKLKKKYRKTESFVQHHFFTMHTFFFYCN